MNIIIPMAGRGSRLRPHTLTIPKPLMPVAGKPIVQRLVEDLIKMIDEPIAKIGFIIKDDFGVEDELKAIAAEAGAEGHIFYQDEPLGTAHAIMCAGDLLEGKTVIAFADTLFKANFSIDTNTDGIIYVQQVENPAAFGVVKLDENKHITDFVEKPTEFVSDLAIIGIYYIKDGPGIKREMQYLMDNDIKDKGEYQLTNALENLKQKGTKFTTGQVEEWLDCGNKNATVYTNQRVLEFLKDETSIPASVKMENSVVVQPVLLGENVTLRNAVVGPHATIGEGSTIENSVVKNALIQNHTSIEGMVLDNTMIGSHANLKGKADSLSLGDYSEMG